MYLNVKIESDENGIFSKLQEVITASIRLRNALSNLEDEMLKISLEEKRDSEESQEF